MTNKSGFEENKNLYNLSIQLNLNGFSFCIATPEGKIITKHDESSNDNVYNEQELLKVVENTFIEKPELQASFNDIQVIYHNNLFTLVPKELFNPNNKNTYLNYSIKTLATDYITHDQIENTGIITVFIPYVNINNFLIDQLGEFNYQHSSSLLIKYALEYSKTYFKEKVYIHVSKGIFEIIITKGTDLLLFNCFSYANNEDLLYYLLFCMEQLNLSPNEIEVILLSNINSDLYDLIYTYVRNVQKSKIDATIFLHNQALKL